MEFLYAFTNLPALAQDYFFWLSLYSLVFERSFFIVIKFQGEEIRLCWQRDITAMRNRKRSRIRGRRREDEEQGMGVRVGGGGGVR